MKILHISDIHYGYLRDAAGAKLAPLESSHVFCDKHGQPLPEVLLDLIVKDDRFHVPPELVIASGDIGWSCDREDYKLALKFFRALRREWPKSQICIIPGNHDARLLGSKISDNSRQNNFLWFLKEFYPPAELEDRFPFLSADERSKTRLEDKEHLTYVQLLPNNVLIVGLNSAASITGLGSPIVISNEHLANVENYVQKLIPRHNAEKVSKILTLHHHVLPFVESNLWAKGTYDPSAPTKFDPTILSNSATFQEWLKKNGFDLVLHGHKHRFHGREDILWTGNPAVPVRNTAIIGAGSAGVNLKHVARADVNSFNVLELYDTSARRTMIKATTTKYEYDGTRPLARGVVERLIDVGEPKSPNTAVFEAQNLVSCHGRISAQFGAGATVQNFLSIVDTTSENQFDRIKSARLGQREAKKIDFELCFSALHPEWTRNDGWAALPNGPDETDRSIAIQHGRRLFRQIYDREGKVHRPIEHALKESVTRRYVGLYDAEIEITSRGANLPGLVGIQFLEAGAGKLDIHLTFRNIELSFWWVVNHLEGLRLLQWACQRMGEFSPGKIIVYSPFAQWLKDDPKPVMRITLETKSLTDLLALVLGSFRTSNKKASEPLRALVVEYRAKLNKNNIYLSGLDNLCIALEAADRAVKSHNLLKQWQLKANIIKHLEAARNNLTDALDDFEKRVELVSKAQRSLDAALAEWT